MPRACCIITCKSSSRNNKEHALFKFPDEQDLENRQRWLNVAGSNIPKRKVNQQYLYICDLHFEEDCFESNDSIEIMKDGVLEEFPRKRKRLKPNCLPSKFPVYIRKEVTQTNSHAVQGKKSTNQPHNRTTDKSVENGKLISVEILVSYIRQLSEKEKNREIVAPDSKGLLSQEWEKLTKGIKAPTSNRDQLTPVNLSSCEPVATKGHSYSTTDLVRDWTALSITEHPIHWCMIQSTLGVVFAYCGDTLSSITRTLIVKHDMSVQLLLNDRVVQKHVVDKITSLRDLLGALLVVCCSNICTGIEERTPCPDGYYFKKAHSTSDRCENCQKSRKKRKNNEKRREQRRHDKVTREKSIIKNIRRKYKRYRNKVISAEGALKDFKASIKAKSDSTIEDHQ